MKRASNLEELVSWWQVGDYTAAEVFDMFLDLVTEENVERLMSELPATLEPQFIKWAKQCCESTDTTPLPSDGAIHVLGDWLARHPLEVAQAAAWTRSMTRFSVIEWLHRGRHLATAVTASRAGFLAWVGIHPIDPDTSDGRSLLDRAGISASAVGARLYRIRKFEIEAVLMEREAEIWQASLTPLADMVVSSDVELEERLTGLGLRLNQLDWPYKSKYPL